MIGGTGSSPSLRHLSLAGQSASVGVSAGLGRTPWPSHPLPDPSGAKDGQIRRTVLEVLSYDPRTHEVLVAAAWEGKTDCYRNIQVEPALHVQIGWVHYRPVQEFLSAEETARLILMLATQHPREVRFVGRLLGIDPDAPPSVIQARLETFFRGVRFRPMNEQGRES